jgi:hypothetical protein
MNPFLFPRKERMDDWKSFRDDLRNHADQIERTKDYWKKAPVGKIKIDIRMPETWPSAWEMVDNGEWCENSIMIGIEFTLRLGGWPGNLALVFIDDILSLEIDGTRLINYYKDTTETYSGNDRIIFSGKKYIKKQ